MSPPLVSVVIATHRRPHWLAEALDSIAHQSHTPMQVIVVEDGAHPGTRDVVAAAKPPIEHYVIPHSGRPGFVRNHGLRHAAGEFVAFLDDDDRWHQDKLSRQVQQLLENAHAPASYTDAHLEYPDGRIGLSVPPPRVERMSTWSALLSGCFIFPSTVLVRRAALTAAGGFDNSLRFAEDYRLWLSLSRQGDFLHLADSLVTMRRHGAGHSSQSNVGIWRDTISALSAELGGGGLSIGDRMRVRRFLALAFTGLGRALPRESPERRRHLWKAFRLSPIRSQWWRVRER